MLMPEFGASKVHLLCIDALAWFIQLVIIGIDFEHTRSGADRARMNKLDLTPDELQWTAEAQGVSGEGADDEGARLERDTELSGDEAQNADSAWPLLPTTLRPVAMVRIANFFDTGADTQ